jgi:hypothetical protein
VKVKMQFLELIQTNILSESRFDLIKVWFMVFNVTFNKISVIDSIRDIILIKIYGDHIKKYVCFPLADPPFKNRVGTCR